MNGKHNNHFYNKNLQPYANQLRKEMTKAEACLWKYVLRAGKMKGYSFRRQRPVLNYITDFMCKELMLVVEVDGSIHELEEVMLNDKIRQQALEEPGLQLSALQTMRCRPKYNGFIAAWKIGLRRRPLPGCSCLRNTAFPLSPAGGGTASDKVRAQMGWISGGPSFFPPGLGILKSWKSGPRLRGTAETRLCGDNEGFK